MDTLSLHMFSIQLFLKRVLHWKATPLIKQET